jgi:hypothetical protein
MFHISCDTGHNQVCYFVLKHDRNRDPAIVLKLRRSEVELEKLNSTPSSTAQVIPMLILLLRLYFGHGLMQLSASMANPLATIVLYNRSEKYYCRGSTELLVH